MVDGGVRGEAKKPAKEKDREAGAVYFKNNGPARRCTAQGPGASVIF